MYGLTEPANYVSHNMYIMSMYIMSDDCDREVIIVVYWLSHSRTFAASCFTMWMLLTVDMFSAQRWSILEVKDCQDT